jgi:hypothetical protein
MGQIRWGKKGIRFRVSFMFGKKEKFVKVCPVCLSDKINSHLGFTGEGYKCMSCNYDNFQPFEFEEKELEKIRAKKPKKKSK